MSMPLKIFDRVNKDQRHLLEKRKLELERGISDYKIEEFGNIFLWVIFLLIILVIGVSTFTTDIIGIIFLILIFISVIRTFTRTKHYDEYKKDIKKDIFEIDYKLAEFKKYDEQKLKR